MSNEDDGRSDLAGRTFRFDNTAEWMAIPSAIINSCPCRRGVPTDAQSFVAPMPSDAGVGHPHDGPDLPYRTLGDDASATDSLAGNFRMLVPAKGFEPLTP